MTRLTIFLSLCCLSAVSSSARAVVEADMPLAQLVKDSQLIAVATLSKLDRDAGKGVLSIDRVLKGDKAPERIPIKLIAASVADGKPDDMLQRVGEGTNLVLFLSSLGPDEHQAFAYADESWFKLRGIGQISDLKTLFVQGEPHLRRTYHGAPADLVKLLEVHFAGTGKLPEIDKTAQPGLGPPLTATSMPQVVAAAPEQIEFGPAWSNGEAAPGNEARFSLPQYIVGSLLLIAAMGLVFMLTRSVPERGA
jgi:hypothetical protein